MIGIVIGVIAAIGGVIVLILIWACLFYKFYWKRRTKLKKKKHDEESKVGRNLNPSYAANTSNGVAKTSASEKVFHANQAFNLAYEGSVDDDLPEDIKRAYGVQNGYVYKEQHSEDSGSGMSSGLEYPYSNSTSRVSAGSDSEGNRSVRFASDLPTLRGDEPPDDGRNKIPKTKMGYWIKPPPTPRGQKPIPMRYVGTKNPVYNKSASGRRASSKDVIAVEVKVPQKNKRGKGQIQTLQPSDVVIKPLNEFEPTSKSPKLSMESNRAYPLLDNVQTAGKVSGSKVVRQRSILKKPKSDGDSVNSNMSGQSVSLSSQSAMSGTDNSEAEMGVIGANSREEPQRRSKRRRPKSLRNAGADQKNVQSAEHYNSVNRSKVPPIAHSSPQGSPDRYRRKTSTENSMDTNAHYNHGQQQLNASVQEARVKMPYDYYPPKSPGNILTDSSLDEPLPSIGSSRVTTRSKDYSNPYDSKKHNRSSSDQESLNYFNNNAVLNQLHNANGPAGPPSAEAVQSRQKRKRKKSTKRSTAARAEVNRGFVDEDDITAVNPRYGVTVKGEHGSETEL